MTLRLKLKIILGKKKVGNVPSWPRNREQKEWAGAPMVSKSGRHQGRVPKRSWPKTAG